MEIKKKNKVNSSQKDETCNQDRIAESSRKDILSRIIAAAFKGQDPSSLAILRFLFGLLMILDIPQERGMASLPKRWGDADVCFFPLFNWMHPLPLEWIYVVYTIMFMGAVGIMLGFMYRLSCCCFVVSYWYMFLLDKTSWNNHSYLYGLTGTMLLITNAHHYWSIDGLIWPSIRNVDVPRWHYGIFKFQFFLVYFYAGLKKLDMDWVRGYSMTGLSRKWVFDPLRLAGIPDDFIDLFFVHICGLTLDLLEGFLLFFDRTRPFGFLFGGMFHLMNAQIFLIGMFPWTMLATMPIFCYPDWPKKLLRRVPEKFHCVLPRTTESKPNIVCSNAKKGKIPKTQFLVVALAAVYAMMQIALPYSHSITKGYNSWTQGLYGYSWDMMVHSWSTQHVVVKVVDGVTGKTTYLKPGAFTNSRNKRWSSHPDMLKQYAMCLSDKLKKIKQLDIQQPRIYVDVWRSLNKRFQQRLVDPNVDIVAAEWSPLRHSSFIRPLLTGLTQWREKLRQIRLDTLVRNNLTDVTFVADFPGLSLENYIDNEVVANITVLHGSVQVEFDGTNRSLGLNDSVQVPRDTTHIVYVTSETPACYMYESYNVTWQNADATLDGIDSDDETSQMIKENQAWQKKTTIDKFKYFMHKKFRMFRVSSENAIISFKRILSRIKLFSSVQ